MATSREIYEAKMLERKYGVVGRVAGRYRTAGYTVEVRDPGEDAPYNFVALKKREKIVVKVFSRQGVVPADVIDSLRESAGSAKKVLVLYGSGPKVTAELVTRARELGVSIKRVRA